MRKQLLLSLTLFCVGAVNSQVQPEFVKQITGFSQIVELNGDAYFVGTGQDIGLWKSDGTTSGTNLIMAFSSINSLINNNGLLYFLADDGNFGLELWKSDGTVVGTVMIKDINPTGDMFPAGYGMLYTKGGNEIYFSADDGVHGVELWKSDGTEAGTFMIKDLRPGSEGAFPQVGCYFNGEFYFDAIDGVVGRELFKTDGTEIGTVLVKDFWVDPSMLNSGWPSNFIVYNNELIFRANSTDLTTFYRGIYKITTSSAIPQLIKEIIGSNSEFYEFQDELYFSNATLANSDYELWKTNGTELGTILVKEIDPSSNGSNPYGFFGHNNTLYFSASPDNNSVNRELFKTDGTEAGTQLVKDINPTIGASSNPSDFFEMNGNVYFIATNDTYGLEIWATDGTNAGTQMAYDINPGTGGSILSGSGFVSAGGNIYFRAYDGTGTKNGLWKFDVSTTGLKENDLNSLKVFPNPAKNQLTITTELNKNTTVVLSSFNGSILNTLELNGETTIDVSTYAPGVYFIRTAEGQTVKFIKE